MAKKDYYIIIDTETTITDKVADFGAVICDKHGEIVSQCAVLVNGIFGVDALFYLRGESNDSLWSEQGKDKRFTTYNNMLSQGTRMLASVAAVNRWLERAVGAYSPILTAYNLAFDVDKCQKTGIDLTIFAQRFCLWHAAAGKWGHTKKYRKFVLDQHAFNSPTALGNMSYKTNAEIMARFILGLPELDNEPHTAIEDVIGYELPILKKLTKNYSKKEILEMEGGYNWREYQVRDHYTPA